MTDLLERLAAVPHGPRNKDKTHCKRGHKFTPENTYLLRSPRHKDGRLIRSCRICKRECNRAHNWGRPRRIPGEPSPSTERNRRYRETHPTQLRDYRFGRRDIVRAYSRARGSLGMAYVDSLRASGCVDCGNKNVTVLDLDHVRGTKLSGLSRMIRSSLTAIDAEAAKCEVRCANCHRIQTAARKKGPRT